MADTNSSVVRTAQPLAEPVRSSSAGVRSWTGGEIPGDVPTAVAEQTKKPFVATLLGVENVYESLGRETQENAQTIDAYFQRQVELGTYEDSEKAYRAYIRKMERFIDVEHAALPLKLGKLAEYVRFRERTEKYERTD